MVLLAAVTVSVPPHQRDTAVHDMTFRIVEIPIVMALRGTCCSPKKSLAASRRVTRSRYTALVRLSLLVLGNHQLNSQVARCAVGCTERAVSLLYNLVATCAQVAY
jgi:hypothetical protein